MEVAERGLSGDDRCGEICLFLPEESAALAWAFSFPFLFEVCFSILPEALCYLSPTPQLDGGLRKDGLCSMAEGIGHDAVRA